MTEYTTCLRCGSADIAPVDKWIETARRVCCSCGLCSHREFWRAIPLDAAAQRIMSQLEGIAYGQAMPTTYAADLWIHDRYGLALGRRVFAWGLYQGGTHMVDTGVNTVDEALKLVRQIGTSWCGDEVHWHWCDGAQVMPVTYAQVEETVKRTACTSADT